MPKSLNGAKKLLNEFSKNDAENTISILTPNCLDHLIDWGFDSPQKPFTISKLPETLHLGLERV